jgi:guanylate kinase
MLLILSGSAGVGKSTLVKILKEERGFEFSTSVTTRGPRPGEMNGVDYHFVSEERFSAFVAAGRFLEHATFANGKRYGTLTEVVIDGLERGKRLLLDIDVQGHAQIRQHSHGLVKSSLFSAFVIPPDMKTLRERILRRGGMSSEEMERRLAEAPKEMARAHEYDEILVNGDLEVMRLDLLRMVDRRLHI